MAAIDVLDRIDDWEWERLVDGDAADRPLIVAYDIRDILSGIQRGVDSANAQLALKADKADLERTSRELHRRIDDTDNRLGAVEITVARAAGWRAGFLVAIGLLGGLVCGLILRLLELV